MASFTQKTIKMVWGRSAGRCAMPDCQKVLFLDQTEADDPALVGQIAHIVGEKKGGPRGKSPMTLASRNVFSNLLLLCGHHHSIIDEQPDSWSVEKLHEIKAAHEAWISERLSPEDKKKIKDEERYAQYLDEWCEMAGIGQWTAWTSHLLANGQPSWFDESLQRHREVPKWTMKKLWPGSLLTLESSFSNYAIVANDLNNVFLEHAEQHGEMWWTGKFYKQHGYDEHYNRRFQDFEHHVDLVQDLVLELTRAANLICDRTRELLIANFRVKEGRLLIESGPNSQMQFVTTLVQYDSEERCLPRPYPGLHQFKADRVNRDLHCGSGQ